MSLYTKGQLVWAKIKGYPWWPGVIAETNLDKNGKIEKEILVNFIGENSHAVLTQDKVTGFAEKEKQYSKSKNKKLQESIVIAQRILDGEVTYEEERQKLIRNEEAAQKSANEEKVKPSNRGRPSLKKKLEAESEKAVSERDKDTASDAKKTPEKNQEKQLYSFKEDVLGLYKKKSSPERETSVKDMEEEHHGKDSPKQSKPDKDSRLAQKQKIKEKERERKAEREVGSYNDLLPFRITRLAPSENNLESQSKNRKKSLKSDSSKLSKRETSTTSEVKHARDIQEALDEQPTRIKARLLIDDDDLLSGYQNSHMPPCVNEKPEEEYMESPIKPSDRRFSEKMEFTEEKLTDVSRTNTNGEDKVTMSSSIESTKPMEVCQSNPTNSVVNNSSMNTKRPSPDLVKSTSVTNSNQPKEKEKIMGEAEYNEYASKKVKLASLPTIEDEKELDEKVLGPEVYNMLLIKKFEDNLTRILDKLSNKLQGMERLKEYDVDMIKILEVIEEFESRNFNGSEFIGSDLGKILKTIHFLLIENKPKLPKTGDLVIIALAKVLHKIKNNILKFCLDNTEYMEALHLPKERTRQVTVTAIDIDFEEIKAKIEEIGNDSKPDFIPISTKIEEESTSAYSQVMKQPVQNNDINVLKQPTQPTQLTQPIVQAPIQQAAVVQPPCAGIKEISKENDRENQGVKPNETLMNDMNLLLRKKICQKLAKLLQRSYYMDKDRSQKMTLLVEDKLNKFYSGNVNEYKQAIKNLHKLIKMQTLKEDELTKILTMTLQEFQQILREKLSDVAKSKAGLYNNDLSPIDNDDVRKDTSPFDFNTYLNPKTNNNLISEDKKRKKSGELKQKLIVEEPDTFAPNSVQTKQEDYA